MSKPERDTLSGRYTTGHEWDGIRELTTPVPNWWLITWFASIAVALLYVVFFPSFAGVGWVARGTLDNTARRELAAELASIAAGKAEITRKLSDTPIADIAADQDLAAFAWQGGRAAFAVNCIACHGAGGGGQLGQFPSLIDDDWLWGGSLEAIAQTVTHGIRNDDPDSRSSEMPAFGEILSDAEMSDVADYVVSLSTPDSGASPEAIARGKLVYTTNCEGCHQPGGTGGRDFGAPRLNDAIWLYGSGKQAILRQLHKPRLGVMPTFGARLDPATIKMLAIYVHSLGGGEASEPAP